MKLGRYLLGLYLGISLLGSSLKAQQQPAAGPVAATVPRLVDFSGKATDVQGKVVSGIVGVTLAIYKDQYEGSPLWLETQSITADAKGNYSVQLGATKPGGLPLDLFSSGEARWLGVTVSGGQEQPRVLLLSVPYALKAADAETIGGLPPSAFVLAAPTSGLPAGVTNAVSSTGALSVLPPNPGVTGAGTANFVPLWDSSSDIVNSVLFQSGTGTTAKVGINTTTPASTLDVKGSETVRGNLSLPATGIATATAGKNSQAETLTASVFNSGTGTAVAQNFRLQAEAAGNDTGSATGSLNLLYGSGGNAISETGLKIASTGKITFVPSQTFPGTGSVSSVGLSAPASDFTVTGSPVTKSGTLKLDWTVAPTQLNIANAVVKRDPVGSFFAQAVNVAELVASNPGGPAVLASTTTSYPAISGNNTGGASGISGTGHIGVLGAGDSAGVEGVSSSGTAVVGISGHLGRGSIIGANSDTSGSTTAYTIGVEGDVLEPTGTTIGAWGYTESPAGTGVAGEGDNGGYYGFGVLASSIIGTTSIGTLGDARGVGVVATSDGGNALVAAAGGGNDTAFLQNQGGGYPLYAVSTNGPGGAFLGSMGLDGSGNLFVSGAISAGTKDFRIDHPLDPANKYLYHASIESSEMKDLYDGVAVLDADGTATVDLPEWFESLNGNFRYQLTAIGAPGPNLYVAQEIAGNRFAIAGGSPGMKVSWQVTGVRHDAFAMAHPLKVSVDKPEAERGYYIHPELYGISAQKSLASLHHGRVWQTAKPSQTERRRMTTP